MMRGYVLRWKISPRRLATYHDSRSQVGEDMLPRWNCSAPLPYGVSLGMVEVNCEGYENQNDPYVLVGSCGLTYTLDGPSRCALDAFGLDYTYGEEDEIV